MTSTATPTIVLVNRGAGFPTPEEAALGGFPRHAARVLCREVCGDHAVVLLGTNRAPRLYPYEVFCHRSAGEWSELGSANGPGWRPTGPDGAGVLTLWREVPDGAGEVVVRHRGLEHRRPVSEGFFLLALWGVACPEWGDETGITLTWRPDERRPRWP